MCAIEVPLTRGLLNRRSLRSFCLSKKLLVNSCWLASAWRSSNTPVEHVLNEKKEIHVDMVLLTWMVDFHPKISRYLYQSVMGNSNDNITKYEYVNSLVYQSETFAGVQKETPVWTGRTLWWKFCWVHRFCSVPKASFLLRNQWAFRSCQAQERRPGGSSISTRYGAPKRPKIHW